MANHNNTAEGLAIMQQWGITPGSTLDIVRRMYFARYQLEQYKAKCAAKGLDMTLKTPKTLAKPKKCANCADKHCTGWVVGE